VCHLSTMEQCAEYEPLKLLFDRFNGDRVQAYGMQLEYSMDKINGDKYGEILNIVDEMSNARNIPREWCTLTFSICGNVATFTVRLTAPVADANFNKI